MKRLLPLGFLALSLTAHAEVAPPATGRCLLMEPSAADKIIASQAYDLSDEHPAQHIGTVGTATYTIRRQVIPAHYRARAKVLLQLILRDPSRDLEVKAIRPAGQTYADDLQLEAPYGLPHALCYPTQKE